MTIIPRPHEPIPLRAHVTMVTFSARPYKYGPQPEVEPTKIFMTTEYAFFAEFRQH